MADSIINLSTAGITLWYAVEETAGTTPTAKASYTQLKGLKSTPSLNPAPETIESTTLEETEWKTYVQGLKDLGGALEFTFNLTQHLVDSWDTLITDYESANGSGKQVWFTIDIPGLTESIYFPGAPSAMGIPELGVDSILEITNYITPTGAPKFAPKPTTGA